MTFSTSCRLNLFCCNLLCAGTLSTGTLSCPITLANTGNIGLTNINVQSPSTACTAGVLEPGSAPHNCTVTLASTLADFEQGSMLLSVAASGTPRGVGVSGPITGQAQSVFALQKVLAVSVPSSLAEPSSVSNAGESVLGSLLSVC